MSVKTVRHAGNLGSAQSERSWSPGVWHDCPIQAILDGEVPGFVNTIDFNNINKTPATTEGNFNDFTQFSSTGGFINAHASGGVTIGSDGDNEGTSFRGRVTNAKISRTTKQFWWELIVKGISSIADANTGIFAGMIEDVALTATVPIAADGTLADQNFFGFHRLEGDGDKIDTVYKANGVTQVTVGTDAITIAADTQIKLGMRYMLSDPTVHDVTNSAAGRYILRFLSNGIPLADYKQIPSAAGTDFPNDVYMSWVVAILNATASSPGTITLDKLRVAQLY